MTCMKTDLEIIKAKLKELNISYCNRPMAYHYSDLYLYDLERNVGSHLRSHLVFRSETDELLSFCLFGLESADIDND